mmetsp:Transcript_25459/g.44294  ORF Transcript_25459/g.44294 Transcript_25459/m.44294 type:complete len:698 (-) Transcript_25459:62-2155(-)|eukprot:CAMPEP_0204898608 /NCGR_PEP_ID=MMETSP1397-20131031/1395_1 /ASSEMBLY_ACC=CAM_ASM_000891 /TAXON_ID=49980 /ORGANISM="Climacostomum Climacostomum virens, Strain Stock W-24" /LENGTH=697 /DNA_ID=CAMNT_0052066489 /DNA_START=647 /DNA_END=2740 /DNA_ORIENTATION=+
MPLSTTSQEELQTVHDIILAGDAESLKELLASVADPVAKAGLVSSVSSNGTMPLHLALLQAYPECVELLMEAGADPTIHYEGSMPIHLSLAMSGFASKRSACAASLRTLLKYEAVVIDSRDRLGRTALHIAALNGASECISLLLQREANPEIKDFSGRLAVEWAIELDQVECLRLMLQEIGSELIITANLAHLAVRHAAWKSFTEILSLGSEAILQLTDPQGNTPGIIAGYCKLSEEFEAVKAGQIPHVPKRTILLTHELCFEHAALPEEIRLDYDEIIAQQRVQVEVPHRLEVILGKNGALSTDYFSQRLYLSSDFPEAPIADVLKVHDYNYIRRLLKVTSQLEGLEHLDRDTVINEKSFKAALVAAGSVIHAVDQVVSDNFTTAFCAVRPPGHHAGPFGEVSSDDPSVSSAGFCLLNNIAIGAAYAIGVHRDKIKRVAIVDIDVHHGNGTQAILENLRPNKVSNKLQLDFATAEVKTYAYKPWLSDNDFDNVVFFSSHGYGHDEISVFYPASGSEEENKECVMNLPFKYGTRSADFRKAYRDVVFPKMLEFKPDLIFISAGFDAHSLDDINHGFVAIDEDDYEWVTGELVRVANTCCKGRIISVLEGGYRTKGGPISALAQSVAAHVRKLSGRCNEEYTVPIDIDSETACFELKKRHEEASSRMNLRKRRRPSPEHLMNVMLDVENDAIEEESLT